MPGVPLQSITKKELFTRLAQGHAAGTCVVTPNRRLAQALKAEFDSIQGANGLAVWEDADILPLAACIERGYEDAFYASTEGLPLLLSPSQERALWEEAIRASSWAGSLLDVPRTAARAMDAWRLAHAWGFAKALDKFGVTEDTRAFVQWARAYQARCTKDGFIDAARLPALGLKAREKTFVAYAFDILSPQAADWLGKGAIACKGEAVAGAVQKASFPSPKDELEAAARWARGRFEAGAKRIGVVVPDLEQRRRELARVFGRVMRPDFNVPAVSTNPSLSPQPFNLSLGQPLSAWPLVSFALSVIEFSLRELDYETVSRLIRSPFLGEAEKEFAQRARLDARLRDGAPAALSLGKLIGLLQDESALRARLKKIFEVKIEKQSPHAWALHFTALLKAAGFPGERGVDSTEYQTRERFNEALRELSLLGIVGAPRLSGLEALLRLRRLCNEALFQPESPEAPVQVLGLLESAGLEFDALWVSGLTDDAWPLRSRPNPFLPLALQRSAGIPEASAEESLDLDRRITGGWTRAAAEVVFSWPRRIDDRDLAPSPLLHTYMEGAPDIPTAPRLRALIFEARAIEETQDGLAPALAGATSRGGTRVLADQAACPFRAFARHRLRAEALEAPQPGPDALDRGSLLHALMAGIWKELGSSSALNGNLKATIEKSAKAAVTELQLEGRFARLEVERLVRLAGDWLDLERARAPFEVVQVEQKRDLTIGGLTFSGRIDRLDRLEDGGHVLIDYKTGSRANARDWTDDGGRPDDPQLPLYAVTASEAMGGIAFAKLRAGDMKFSGFTRDLNVLPGVKPSKDWAHQMQGWKKSLDNLATSFAAGDAAMDPKRGLQTCANCDLQPLCRVHEKIGGVVEDEE